MVLPPALEAERFDVGILGKEYVSSSGSEGKFGNALGIVVGLFEVSLGIEAD